jgi:hypothetical protein
MYLLISSGVRMTSGSHQFQDNECSGPRYYPIQALQATQAKATLYDQDAAQIDTAAAHLADSM